MYKNIIPNLVSIDTTLKKIKGLHICSNLNYFICTKQKNRFHYKVVVKEKIIIPNNYEFRNNLFFKKGNCWYYEKKFFFLTLKFSYDELNKIFSFNRNYMLLPFRIGGVYMPGDHISNIIALELFLAGFIYTGGMAFQIKNKNICIISPGFNGKASILKYALKKGAKYIAEDILVIDIKTNEVYTTCPVLEFNFWQGRKIDGFIRQALGKGSMFAEKYKINTIYLVKNSLTLNYIPQNTKLFDFIFLCSFHFFSDGLVKAYIFNHNLTSLIIDQIRSIKKIKLKCKFYSIYNFNFMQLFNNYGLSENTINKKYWHDIGSHYSEVWETKVRQKLSDKELSFITKYLLNNHPIKILDIGIGNGRILEVINTHSLDKSEIYGIDIAKSMVAYSKQLFYGKKKIKALEINDISKENIRFETNFDFITAIRVLKYNRNWQEILSKVYKKLNKNGLFIFSIPNIYSITLFHKDTFSDKNIPISYTAPDKLRKILSEIGFDIEEIRGFSKIPDVFYRICDNHFYIKVLFLSERILELIFGRVFLARYFFVVCKKN